MKRILSYLGMFIETAWKGLRRPLPIGERLCRTIKSLRFLAIMWQLDNFHLDQLANQANYLAALHKQEPRKQ